MTSRPYCCSLAEWEGSDAEHARTCPERRAEEVAERATPDEVAS